ncbi:MAG: hypothetical protein KDJ17_12640 [Hyphomicrobiaceae bacterium]|nr:hypothetical protein [Hyphomicrobiaceae bacterium]
MTGHVGMASWISQFFATLTVAALVSACSGQQPNATTAQAPEVADAQQGQRSGPPALPSLAGPPASDPTIRTAPVVPGRPGRVFIFAGVDQNCAELPAPQVSVTNPPLKGDVSFRPGQATTIAASAQGTCIGTKAKGTGVYYTARAGSTGSDTFSVTARLASGELMTRQFQVQIAQ